MPVQQITVKPLANGTKTYSAGPGLNTVSDGVQVKSTDFHVDIPPSLRYRDNVSWWALFYKSVPEGIGIGGMKYAFNPAEMRLRRLFWLLLMLTALGFLLFQVIDRAQHLSSHPTSVDVYTNYTESLTFPTVAICNFNIFRSSMVTGTIIADYLMEFFLSPSSHLNSSSPYYQFLNNVTLSQLMIEYGHDLHQSVLSAVWKKLEVLDLDIYFTIKMTDFGLCFVFNDAENGNPPLTITRSGTANGIDFQLNVQPSEYFLNPFFRYSTGFQVHIYEYGSVPLIQDQGFGISPGTYTHVGMEVTEAFNLEPPYGLCQDRPLKYFNRYGYNECYIECLMDYSYNACACLASGSGIDTEGMRECSAWETFTCIQRTYGGFLNHTCDCPVACRVRTYKPSISTTDYPSASWENFIASNYDIPAGYFKENICYLSIYFKEISIQQITQNKDYNFFSFLCDIGGSLGLWLGGSILTVFEIFDLFGNSMYLYFKRIKNFKK